MWTYGFSKDIASIREIGKTGVALGSYLVQFLITCRRLCRRPKVLLASLLMQVSGVRSTFQDGCSSVVPPMGCPKGNTYRTKIQQNPPLDSLGQNSPHCYPLELNFFWLAEFNFYKICYFLLCFFDSLFGSHDRYLEVYFVGGLIFPFKFRFYCESAHKALSLCLNL